MTASSATVSVLFVCMGNICRSPTGEGVFRHYVTTKGRGASIHIDSAGTIDYHAGSPADSRMREAAASRGYRLDSIARVVRSEDLQIFDLVIAMDHDNLDALLRLSDGYSADIQLLGAFLPGVASNAEAPAVPDPYYGGGDGFERVIDMIENACPAILDHCLRLLPARGG